MVFCFQNSFSQEYTFDNFYEYNTVYGTNFYMNNSTNENYLFYGYTRGETIYGYIFDFNTNEFHYYDVANYNNSVSFTYSHSYSRKNEMCSCDKDGKRVSYTYTTESIDSLKTKITITKIKTKRNGKIKFLGKVELSYENNEKYIFYSNHLRLYSHHFLVCNKVFSVPNKLPIKVFYDYHNGVIATSNLTKRKKINTLLSLSKEQIVYR